MGREYFVSFMAKSSLFTAKVFLGGSSALIEVSRVRQTNKRVTLAEMAHAIHRREKAVQCSALRLSTVGVAMLCYMLYINCHCYIAQSDRSDPLRPAVHSVDLQSAVFLDAAKSHPWAKPLERQDLGGSNRAAWEVGGIELPLRSERWVEFCQRQFLYKTQSRWLSTP